jgi:hypothetical protein
MAIYKNTPPIVTNGLIMYFDAANTKSYTSGSTTVRNLNLGYTNITSSILQNQNSTVTLPQYTTEGGGSFLFNGTGSAILVASNPQAIGFWPKPQLTLETWFKTPSTGSGQAGGAGIFGFTYGIRLNITTIGTITTSYNNSLSSSIQAQTSGENYYDNRWHHVVSQTDGNTTYLYVDGILRGQTTNANPWTGTSPWPTDRLNVGRDNNNTNYFFLGSIGPVRVYDRVLSAQEVLQNYNATKGRFNIT